MKEAHYSEGTKKYPLHHKRRYLGIIKGGGSK